MPETYQYNAAEKIFVPPSLPSIMKGYCKAAIRTQPYDLLRWSAAYFRSLANGENPPVKDRLEFPSTLEKPGLTPGFLKVLINQIGRSPDIYVTTENVAQKWTALSLPLQGLDPILSVIGSDDNFLWLRFVAVAAGSICSSLTQTMITLCELLTNDPEGGKASIPVDIFTDLYQYLAMLDCGPPDNVSAASLQNVVVEADRSEDGSMVGEDGDHVVKTTFQIVKDNGTNGPIAFRGIGPPYAKDDIKKVVEFFEYWGGKQDGFVMPRNLRHWMCPPLENTAGFLE